MRERTDILGGFTLVELLVVVAIIAIMLSTAALSVGSGTASVRMKNAVRSVWQLSGYARTMALLRQHAVVVTYSEVWEGDTFVKSKIEVKAGAEISTPSAGQSSAVARSIFDPEAEVPTLEDETEEDSAESVVQEGLAERAFEFPDVRMKVELKGEEGDYGNEKRKAVSAFSNVDYLLGRSKAAADDKGKEKKTGGTRSGASASDDEEETEQETRDPVSIVFETNGRCEPHRVLVWRDGKGEESATVLEVDRFGAMRNPESEDDDK
ncbi:MAG: prepilin-type N-terminal cleavage/methylation domain-containing protein [Kiritimatiellae bacterium]|nr:prepilin-type N-terminal cleavage/methylation domain-containing protein [Kiritimatiellia bacterium]